MGDSVREIPYSHDKNSSSLLWDENRNPDREFSHRLYARHEVFVKMYVIVSIIHIAKAPNSFVRSFEINYDSKLNDNQYV